MNILPVLLKDGYKTGHVHQFPKGTTMVYSNMTPRGSRVAGVDGVIFFGLQYFLQEYLIDQFDKNFFQKDRSAVLKAYQRRIDNYLGPGTDVSHIGALHDLGYLPLEIKALPEGSETTHSVTECRRCPFFEVEGMEHMMYCYHPRLKEKTAPGYPYGGAIITQDNSRGRVPDECPLRGEVTVVVKRVLLLNHV